MPTIDFEARLWAQGFTRIMGLDEVGRGCLAGPVVAAGVIFRPDRIPPGIDDSKKLSADRRRDVAIAIREAKPPTESRSPTMIFSCPIARPH
jgi:ribonuclease HII